MKVKILFSTDRNGGRTMLKEMFDSKNSQIEAKAVWINPNFFKENHFRKSLKWTRNIPVNIELMVIDDAPEYFDFSPFYNLVNAGFFPIYQGKFKPIKMVELPEIIISTRFEVKELVNDCYEVYEFPDLTNPII